MTLGLLSISCSEGTDDAQVTDVRRGVRVGSFDFVESELISELYAQVLESNDLHVVRLGVIGPREIVAPALEGDLVDVVPEYTGTAAEHYEASAIGTTGQARELTTEALLESRGLVMLEPAPAENVNVFVVTSDLAIRHDLSKVSDLSGLSASLRFGGPVECRERPFCLAGLSEVYGLEFAEFVAMQSLAVTADALLREEVEVGVMFSTATEMRTHDFVVLEDDRALQPEEHIVPLVRIAATEHWGPTLAESLNGLSRKLTTEDVQQLNRMIADGSPIGTVAADWLANRGGGDR